MSATILIVEDHDALRTALRDWLAVQYPRCRIIQAASGEEALALTETESPHLVVMDVYLPGMSGIEATRRIKAVLPSVQVVMLTVHDGSAYRAHAAAAGASAYVPKASMQADLLPAVNALLATIQD